MKLSKTAMIKGLSVQDSIVAAINEMFNENASFAFNECLVVDGFVGTCIEHEVKDNYTVTRTSYFIATQVLGTDFVRVDYYGDTKVIWSE